MRKIGGRGLKRKNFSRDSARGAMAGSLRMDLNIFVFNADIAGRGT